MIVIHIGLSKSGSTTIQTFLDSNEDALREASIDYPRLGRKGRLAHHNFANELKGRADKFNPQSGRVSELTAYLRTSNCQTTILSSETFATCDDEAVGRLRQVLATVDQPVRVVMIVRNMVERVQSSYAQKIRHGFNTHDFDTFFDKSVDRDKFNFFEAAGNWADVFGWEAVRVRLLESALLLNGDLIDDFLDVAGLDPDARELRALPRLPRVNESAGWMTLEAVRALFSGRSGLASSHPLARLVAGDLPEFRKKRIGLAAEEVGAEFGWNRNKGRYLTREQAERMHSDHVAALRSLNEYISDRLPEPGDLDARGFVERDFMPDVSHIPAGDLRTFYDAVESRVTEQERARKAIKRAGARH